MKRRLAKEFQPEREGERERREREGGRVRIIKFFYSELFYLLIIYHTYCRPGLCFLLG